MRLGLLAIFGVAVLVASFAKGEQGMKQHGTPTDEANDIQVTISNGAMIFALYGQYGLIRDVESYRNSIMVNKIKLTNVGSRPVTVDSCAIRLNSKGRNYVQTLLDIEWIKQEAKNGLKDMTNPRRQEMFKGNPFYAGEFVEGPIVAKDKSLVLQNQFFEAYTPHKVDALQVDFLLADGRHARAEFKVGAYEQKNEYIFPMRGDLGVVGGPNHIWGHRMSLPQEFAFDIMVVKDTRFYKGDPFKPENHFCFGQDVIAPADGTIVTADDGLPDNRVPYDFKAIEEQAAEQPKGMSIVYSSGGNRVAIDHGKSEFSSFAHLMNGSLRVKKGDKVKQGQIIARCGNSGSGSTSPHLHFHFMSSPDFPSAVGLPISFKNLDNAAFSDEALRRMSVPPDVEKLFAGWGAEIALVKTK